MRAYVRKYGSSVLSGPEGYRKAAREIARETARGSRIVAVVSAMGRTTDRLLAAARELGPDADDELVGALLATGEEESALLLAIALAEAGVSAAQVPCSKIPLRTRGRLLDADPVYVQADRLYALLSRHRAVVVPGFVGRDVETGRVSLLGRGGSDLTALCLGAALRAREICLVKDVDGVYPVDPRRVSTKRALTRTSWEMVRRVGGGVVQHKALDYARSQALGFRVAALGGKGTWVGPAA